MLTDVKNFQGQLLQLLWDGRSEVTLTQGCQMFINPKAYASIPGPSYSFHLKICGIMRIECVSAYIVNSTIKDYCRLAKPS